MNLNRSETLLVLLILVLLSGAKRLPELARGPRPTHFESPRPSVSLATTLEPAERPESPALMHVSGRPRAQQEGS